MVDIHDLQCGKAGEYLVCADLILMGHVAFPSEQGLSFDVVVDVDGRLLKVQVKTTRTTRVIPQRATHTAGYLFHVRRCGKNGRRSYSSGDVDIFALVALDAREIGYIAAADAKQTMIFRSSKAEGMYHDEKCVNRAKQIVAMRETGMSFRKIGKELGVDAAYAHRVCIGTSGTERQSRYLADFSFADAVNRVR